MPAPSCSTPRRSRPASPVSSRSRSRSGRLRLRRARRDHGGHRGGIRCCTSCPGSRATAVSNVALTVLAAYISWILGEKVGASAVLACVACGLTMRRHYLTSGFVGARGCRCAEVWGLFVFVLNGFIFVLLGLEWPRLAVDLPPGGLRKHRPGHGRRVRHGGAGAARLASAHDVRRARFVLPARRAGSPAATRVDAHGRLDRHARHRDAGGGARRSHACRSPARHCPTAAASSSSPSRSSS